MTIVSRGYEGQIMPNLPWAEWQQGAGHEYVASHYDAGRVSIVTATPLTVRVNASPTVDGLRAGIGGHGVYDIITASEDITITASLPSAGQSKWYTVVARRTWQTTQATAFTALTGTATQAIAAGRQKTPGTVDDQPLALVQVTNGTSGLAITAVIDLRPVSRGGTYIVDPPARDLVMGYFNKVGYRLRVGASVFERTVTGGSEAWSVTGGDTLTAVGRLQRSNGDPILNVGATDLKVASVATTGAGWDTAWRGSGIGNSTPGLYWVQAAVLTDGAAGRFEELDPAEFQAGTVNLGTRLSENSPAGSRGAISWGGMLYCPNGLGVRFKATSTTGSAIRVIGSSAQATLVSAL